MRLEDADAEIVTIQDALAACARLRDRAHEAESLYEYWRDTAQRAEDALVDASNERAALVQQIERKRGEHWARVMDVVRAAQALAVSEYPYELCMALEGAVRAYEVGGVPAHEVKE